MQLTAPPENFLRGGGGAICLRMNSGGDVEHRHAKYMQLYSSVDSSTKNRNRLIIHKRKVQICNSDKWLSVFIHWASVQCMRVSLDLQHSVYNLLGENGDVLML